MSKQLTKNFNSKEFNCKDGTEVPNGLMHNVQELAENLQKVRNVIKKPIVISSGYRTNSHNKKVGGAKQSYHLSGRAADIRIKGIKPIEIWEIMFGMMRAGEIKQGGLILYENFIHYDTRGYEMAIKG